MKYHPTSEIRYLKSKRESKQQALRALRHRVNELPESLENYRAILESFENELRKKFAEIPIVEKEIADLDAEIERKEKTQHEKIEGRAEIKKEIEKGQKELERLKARLEKLAI